MKDIGVVTVLLLAAGSAFAQNGPMMNDGMGGAGGMGGYGEYWRFILLFVAVVGIGVWIVRRKGK